MREAVSGYRRMTLAAELRGAEAALDAAGIDAERRAPGGDARPEVETVLAWAVREGTTNVIRHSGARRCAIRVHAGLGGRRRGDRRRRRARGRATATPTATAAASPACASASAAATGRLEAGRRPEGGFRLAVDVPRAP